jgi:hypothetical protein
VSCEQIVRRWGRLRGKHGGYVKKRGKREGMRKGFGFKVWGFLGIVGFRMWGFLKNCFFRHGSVEKKGQSK